MDHVIRLRPGQNQTQPFGHPLLDNCDDYKLTPQQFKTASQEEKQLSMLWLIRWMVGKYLFHWPMTEPFLDDMCSVGFETLCGYPDLTNEKGLINKLHEQIETYLNNNRAIVRASLSTNKSRSSEGRELEYAESESLYNVGAEDMDLLQAELIDTLTPKHQKLVLDNRHDNDDETE